MKGFVPTPPHLVDAMVDKLFRHRAPTASDRLLDPGCGTGVFIHGVLRWCDRNRAEIPQIVGVEADFSRAAVAKQGLGHVPKVTVRFDDFLQPSSESFDFIIGNPPYVSLTGLTGEERIKYRRDYSTARGRFDLYVLFFEQALRLLKPDGRLVFVTPEKFLYVESAENLRRALGCVAIEEIDLIAEDAFGPLVTYPTVTTIAGKQRTHSTEIRLRNGGRTTVTLTDDGASWLPQLSGGPSRESGPVLADAFERISCGVATGADGVFVVDEATVQPPLREFAFPTISGRQLVPWEPVRTRQVMLVPYSRTGDLFAESKLGALGDYLREPSRKAQLLKRTCVSRKPWYAFHENPPFDELLKPKILCKDIGQRPWFVVDYSGQIIPRHSVYYLVPRDPAQLNDLCEFLNSADASEWLIANCQRAANGFLRLQSHVLKRLPLSPEYVPQDELLPV